MNEKGLLLATLTLANREPDTIANCIYEWFQGAHANIRNSLLLPNDLAFIKAHVCGEPICGSDGSDLLYGQVNKATPVHVDPLTLDPTSTGACVVFYLLAPAPTKRLYIFGMLRYRDLIRDRGHCTVGELRRKPLDFVLDAEEFFFEDTRASFSIWSLADSGSGSGTFDLASAFGGHCIWLWLPMHEDELRHWRPQGAPVVPRIEAGGIADVEHRMQMLAEIYELQRSVTPTQDALFAAMDENHLIRYFTAQPQRDYTSWALCCQVSAMQALPPAEAVFATAPASDLRYEEIRLSAEWALHGWRMNRFFNAAAGGSGSARRAAKAWCYTIAQNLNLPTREHPWGIYPPTPRDHWFAAQQPSENGVPAPADEYYFVVSYEEYPMPTAGPMPPVYDGNTARVPLSRMSDWLWQRYVRTAQHVFNMALVENMSRSAEQGQQGRLKLHVAMAERDVNRLLSGRRTMFSGAELQITDVEDLCLAPCMRRALNASPLKNAQRLAVAKTLVGSHVSLAMADAVFAQAIPRLKPELARVAVREVKRRWWNWTNLWEAVPSPRSAPCTVYIENAQRQLAATVHCPFVGACPPVGGAGAGDVQVSCMRACTAAFAEQHPGYVRQGDAVRNPNQWTMWRATRGNRVQPGPAGPG
jgi:hypothetical protein